MDLISISEFLAPNRYEIDLSNEVLKIYFGQGAAKISEVKVGVKKSICRFDRLRAQGFKPDWLADIFFKLQLWPLVFLQPLDQNQSLVPHLKDLFHICLEPKAQGFWMTFNLFNCGSKYPYFNRAYVVSSGFGCLYLYIIVKTIKEDIFSFCQKSSTELLTATVKMKCFLLWLENL